MNSNELEELIARTGLTIKEFDRGGPKDSIDLLDEVDNGVKLIWSEKRKRIVRYSRRIAVALVTTNGFWLRQVGLVYPERGKFIPSLKKVCISGTLNSDETPQQAAARETAEECELVINAEEFVPISLEEPDWHPSDAYNKDAVYSCAITSTCLVEIPEKPPEWLANPVFKDGKKLVYCEWFKTEYPYIPNMKSMAVLKHNFAVALEISSQAERTISTQIPPRLEQLLAILAASEQ